MLPFGRVRLIMAERRFSGEKMALAFLRSALSPPFLKMVKSREAWSLLKTSPNRVRPKNYAGI